MFKEGDCVISKFGKCRIKKISGSKCTVEFEKPVMASTVKIVELSSLKVSEGDLSEDFNGR